MDNACSPFIIHFKRLQYTHCKGPGQSVEGGWGSSLRCNTDPEKKLILKIYFI